MNERERIEFIISMYGLSPSQFADKTGIPRASVSHILSGRNKPSLEILQKVAAVFPEVDLNWLMLGNGEPPSVIENLQVMEVAKAKDEENSLFSDDYSTLRNENKEVKKTAPVTRNNNVTVEEQPKSVKNNTHKIAPVERVARRGSVMRNTTDNVKFIKEVRVFYSDGTYEILYPEK